VRSERMKRIKGFGGRSYGGKGEKLLKEMMKLQEEFQKRVKELEESFSELEVEATAGGGVVKVKATCNYEIKDIEIDPDVVEDVDMLRDLLIAAVNEAMRKIEEKRQEETEKISQQFGIPGII